MRIEKGMIFRGNKNGRLIKILETTSYYIRYQDLKYMTVFTVGKQLFERCDISEVAE